MIKISKNDDWNILMFQMLCLHGKTRWCGSSTLKCRKTTWCQCLRVQRLLEGRPASHGDGVQKFTNAMAVNHRLCNALGWIWYLSYIYIHIKTWHGVITLDDWLLYITWRYIKYMDDFRVGAHQKVFGRVDGQMHRLLDKHCISIFNVINVIEFHRTSLRLHCIVFLCCCPTSAGNKDGIR